MKKPAGDQEWTRGKARPMSTLQRWVQGGKAFDFEADSHLVPYLLLRVTEFMWVEKINFILLWTWVSSALKLEQYPFSGIMIGVKHVEISKELDCRGLPSLMSLINESEKHIASSVKYISNLCHVQIWMILAAILKGVSQRLPFMHSVVRLLIPMEFFLADSGC